MKDGTSFTAYTVSQILWITRGTLNEPVLIRNKLAASTISSGIVSKDHMWASFAR